MQRWRGHDWARRRRQRQAAARQSVGQQADDRRESCDGSVLQQREAAGVSSRSAMATDGVLRARREQENTAPFRRRPIYLFRHASAPAASGTHSKDSASWLRAVWVPPLLQQLRWARTVEPGHCSGALGTSTAWCPPKLRCKPLVMTTRFDRPSCAANGHLCHAKAQYCAQLMQNKRFSRDEKS